MKPSKAPEMVSVKNSDTVMRLDAAQHMNDMLSALKEIGLPQSSCVSGYRSYARQSYNFNIRIDKQMSQGHSYEDAYKIVSFCTAPPGTSEYQSGLAIDLSLDGTLTSAFGKTKSGQWLADNSWRYGYILRYTSEKSSYTMIGPESWHFRYVGAPHAEIMYKNNWCFEEYMIALIGGSIIFKSDDGYIYTVRRTASLPAVSGGFVPDSSDNIWAYIVTSRVCPKDIPLFYADISKKLADALQSKVK